jgi:uncharacterized membrane protein YdjX (TVP38/TMEM64 family)
MSPNVETPGRPASSARVALAFGFAAVLLAVVVLLSVPATRDWFNRHLLTFFDFVQGMQGWGPIVVGAAYIPACLLFLPGSPVTLFGGFAFGATLAGLARVTACVSVGSTLGASLAFLVGRYLARGWIESRVAAHPRFRAIDVAVGKEGFKIVLLTRLSPAFPFNLLNYGFGLTGVSFRDYVAASWLGMLPGTILFVYVGSTTRQLADILAGKVEASAAQQVFFYVGLAATVLATVVITRVARRALDAAIPETPTNDLEISQGNN